MTSITRSRTSTTSTAQTSFLYDSSSDEDDQAASSAHEGASSPLTLCASTSQSDLQKDVSEHSAPAPEVPLNKPPMSKLEAITAILGRVKQPPLINVVIPPVSTYLGEKNEVDQRLTGKAPTMTEDLFPAEPEQVPKSEVKPEPPQTPISVSTEPEHILHDLANLLTSTEPPPDLHRDHPLIHRIQHLNPSWKTISISKPPVFESIQRIFPQAPNNLVSTLYSNRVALEFVKSSFLHAKPNATSPQHPKSSTTSGIPSKALLMLGLEQKQPPNSSSKLHSADDTLTIERNARRRANKTKAESVQTILESRYDTIWSSVLHHVYDTTSLTSSANAGAPLKQPPQAPIRTTSLNQTSRPLSPDPDVMPTSHFSVISSSVDSFYDSEDEDEDGGEDGTSVTDESEWLYGGVCFQPSTSTSAINSTAPSHSGNSNSNSDAANQTSSRAPSSKRAALRHSLSPPPPPPPPQPPQPVQPVQPTAALFEALETAVAEVVKLGEAWVAEAVGEEEAGSERDEVGPWACLAPA